MNLTDALKAIGFPIGSKSVDDILKVFTSAISDLKQRAVDTDDELKDIDTAIAELTTDRNDTANEGIRARAIVEKLTALLEV